MLVLAVTFENTPLNVDIVTSITLKMKFMNKLRHSLTIILIVASLTPNPAGAQQPTPAKKFELTVDSIMRGPDLVGYEPANNRQLERVDAQSECCRSFLL